MKVDKRKLFEAIIKNETKDFFLTYDTNNFEYSPRDIGFTYKSIAYRTFNGVSDNPSDNYFIITSQLCEQEIPIASEGFFVLASELAKLGCLKKEEMEKEEMPF